MPDLPPEHWCDFCGYHHTDACDPIGNGNCELVYDENNLIPDPPDLDRAREAVLNLDAIELEDVILKAQNEGSRDGTIDASLWCSLRDFLRALKDFNEARDRLARLMPRPEGSGDLFPPDAGFDAWVAAGRPARFSPPEPD